MQPLSQAPLAPDFPLITPFPGVLPHTSMQPRGQPYKYEKHAGAGAVSLGGVNALGARVASNLSSPVPRQNDHQQVWNFGAGTAAQEKMGDCTVHVKRHRGQRRGKKHSGLAAAPSRVIDQVGIQEHEKDYSHLITQLKSSEKLAEVASFIRGYVAHLAFQLSGCFLVQEALERLSLPVTQKLAAEMKGHVQAAIVNKHANFVLAKIIDWMPWAKAAFVAQELHGSAAKFACHKFGCRVIMRLVEHQSKENAATAALMNEVLSEVTEVAKSEYGKHVVKAILEHGTPEQKHLIAHTLCANLRDLIQGRHAREVLVEVLHKCSSEDQKSVSCGLSSTMERLLLVATRKNGNHLIEAALAVDSDSAQQMRSQLVAIVPSLASSENVANKTAKQVLELIQN